MATLTHRALRELILEFGGCDYFFSEMISARGLLNGGHLEQYYVDAGPHPDRVIYQLMGSDADSIAAAAAMLDERDCAGIDINMGCAAPAITRQGGGVSWMSDYDSAIRMVDQVRRQVTRHPLSVKLRLGFDEDPERVMHFCRGLEQAGVEMITMHPRTAKQKFKRTARWSFVELAAEHLHIPVIGNGDVTDASRLVARSRGPWSGVMVGRGAVQQPWIFAQARAAGQQIEVDREAVALQFLELLRRRQPAEFWKSRAHRFFAYYCTNFAWGHNLNTGIHRESDTHAMGALVRQYFRRYPQERILSVALVPNP
ncbi:tRNA dihydrouridine synthase [Spirochaeta africana]|nr:tRNA-dihydrouridine synthase family protein [Spirochaeta africana]